MKSLKQYLTEGKSDINPEWASWAKKTEKERVNQSKYVKQLKTYITKKEIGKVPHDAFYPGNAEKGEASGAFRTHSVKIKYKQFKNKSSSLPSKGPWEFVTYKNVLIAIITSDPSNNTMWKVTTTIPGQANTSKSFDFKKEAFGTHKLVLNWIDSKFGTVLKDLIK